MTVSKPARSLIVAALIAATPPCARAQVAATAPPAPANAKADAHHAAPSKRPPVVKPHGPVHAVRPAKPAHPAAVKTAPPPTAAPSPPPAASAAPAEPNKGTSTGRPLPRFASLRSDEVNLRAGPGTRYPIDWLYKRRDLPVEIEREFDVWRLVRDPDGVQGWVHEATLTARRDFVVTGADRTLRQESSDTAPAVAILKPGVIGRLLSCDAGSDWCRAQVGSYRGYLRRTDIWGVLPGEVVAPG